MKGRSPRGLGQIPLGAVAVVAALAVVVAIGFFGPKRGSVDVAPTADASAVSVATASPTIRVIPSASMTVRPTPVPTPPPGAIFAGNPTWAAWSPNGDEVAISHMATDGNDRLRNFVDIVSLRNHSVVGFQADQFWWLDSGDYVAEQLDVSDPAVPVTAFVGHAANPEATPLPEGMQVALVGPGSRLALVGALTPTGLSTRYVVWSAKRTLGPRDGRPIAFSPDGSRLAVVRTPTQAEIDARTERPESQIASKLEVTDATSGKVVASVSGAGWPYGDASFSPDGRYVACNWHPLIESTVGRVTLLEIASGRHWQAEGIDEASFLWKDPTHLTIWNATGTGPKIAFPVTVGYESYATLYVPGAVESPFGWKATWSAGTSVSFVSPAGVRSTVDLQAPILSVYWSPKRAELLVIWGSTTLATGDGSYSQTGQFVSIIRP